MWRGLVLIWACIVGALLGGEGKAVRLRGFEPEEMKAFGKPGRPIGTRSPEPGFRAEPPDPAGDSYVIYDAAGSRDWPKLTLAKAHATEGDYALRHDVGDWHERHSRQPAITGHPPIGGYHDALDWLWQRHCLIWAESDAKRPLDWSAFERLRFDVFGGVYTKHSDDDGLTWKPCKDASVAPLPRPFYEPRPGAPPPKEVLLWPAEPVVGPLLVPYKGKVAAFAYDGSRWAAHDGAAWEPPQKVPWKRPRGGQVSEAVLGDAHVFLARTEGEEEAKSLAAIQLRDGAWGEPEDLAAGKLVSSILTASGSAVFCFYAIEEAAEGKLVYTIYARRWADGAWAAPERLATEADRINELAAPTVCPRSYAAVFWDQHTTDPRRSTWLRFARIPNL